MEAQPKTSCRACRALKVALEHAMSRLRNQGGDISEITHEANMITYRECESALMVPHCHTSPSVDEALNSGGGSYRP